MTLCLILQMLPVQSIAYAVDEGEAPTDEQVVQVQGDEETDAVVQEDEPGEPAPEPDPEPVVEEEKADVSAPADVQGDDQKAEPVVVEGPAPEPESQPAPAADEPAAITIEHRTIECDVLEADGTAKATVEVEGELPSDATLALLELDADAAAKLAGEANDARFAYDVSIVSEGKEWHAKDADAKYVVRVTLPEGMEQIPEDLSVTHYRDVTVAKGDPTTEPLALDEEALDALLARIADNDDTLKAEVRMVGAENPDDAIVLTEDGRIEFELTGLSPIIATTPKPAEEEVATPNEDEQQPAEEIRESTPAIKAPDVDTNLPGGSGDTNNGLHYEWRIGWNSAGADIDGDEGSVTLHPTIPGTNTIGYVEVPFNLQLKINKLGSESTGVIKAGTLKITIPLHAFYGWDPNADYVGDSNVTYGGTNPGAAVDTLVGYDQLTQEGNTYGFLATEEDGNLVLTNTMDLFSHDIKIVDLLKYRVCPLKVNGGHPSAPGVDVGNIQNWWEDYEDFYKYDLKPTMTIDVDADGTLNPATDVSEGTSMHVEMRTRAVANGKAFPMPTRTNGVYLEWNPVWGEKPADADDNFYIVWNLSYGRGKESNTRMATQGFESTVTAPDSLNTVTIGDTTFQGKLVSIAQDTYRTTYTYVNLNPIPTYGSNNANYAYTGTNPSLQSIATTMDNTFRNVRYNGYGYTNNNGRMQWALPGTSLFNTASQYTGTNYAILMSYPKSIIQKVRDEHPDDPDYMEHTGFKIEAKFQVDDKWDSDYTFTKEIPASPAKITIVEEGAGSGLAKRRYPNTDLPMEQGGQTLLQSGTDVWINRQGTNYDPYSSSAKYSWTSTFTGTSDVEGSNNLGQHIVLTDTRDSTLDVSSSIPNDSDTGEFGWNPDDLVKISGDNGDYSCTGFRVKLSEFEATYSESSQMWNPAQDGESTDYASYEPVYVYVRTKGATDFTPYAVVMRTGAEGTYTYNAWDGTKDADGKPVLGDAIATRFSQYVLPPDTVQVQLVHDSGTHTASDGTQKEFRRCSMVLDLGMQIHPTQDVQDIIDAHIAKGAETYVKDITGYEVSTVEPSSKEPRQGSNRGDGTGSARAAIFRLNEASRSLTVTKASETPAPADDALQREAAQNNYQISYVTLNAFSEYLIDNYLTRVTDAEDPYTLYSGTFYDLLPKGVTYRDGSVRAFVDYCYGTEPRSPRGVWNTTGGEFGVPTYIGCPIPQSDIQVTSTVDPTTGQTLLKIDYTLSDEAQIARMNCRNDSSTWHQMIRCAFIVENTYENIKTFGINTDNACAYVQKGDEAGHIAGTQEMLDDAALGNRAAAFQDLVDGETISRFNKANIKWNAGAIVELDTSKTVAVAETIEGAKAKNAGGVPLESIWEASGTVTPGNDYTYRLTMAVDENTKSKDIVFYDVLERGAKIASETHESAWQGTFVGVDTSAAAARANDDDSSATCAPVVYYSTTLTQVMVDDDDYGELTDTSIWTKASDYTGDLADVTAIAIDCRLDTNDNEFVLSPNEMLPVFVSMTARTDVDASDEPVAVNGMVVRAKSFEKESSGEGVPVEDLLTEATVTLRDVDIKIAKDSSPATGTEHDPTIVAADGTGEITYRLRLTNDNPYDIKNVVATDTIPDGLTVTGVEVRLNGAESATDASSTDGFAMDHDGNAYTFTVANQWPGADNATEILIHCTVDSLYSDANGGAQVASRDYENTAYLTEANGKSFVTTDKPNGEPTETTYHRAESATVVVEKAWDGNESHPASVDVHLTGTAGDAAWPESGSTAGDATLSENTSWEHTYADLPRWAVDDTDASFDEPTTWAAYEWTVTEDPIDGYRGNVAKAVDGNTTTFTLNNVYDPPSTDVDFLKLGQLPTDKGTYEPLAGAEFTLFSDEACETALKDLDDADLVTTTDSDGKGLFEGVPFTSDPKESQEKDSAGKVTADVFTTEDTYYMKETDAPDGWVENETVYAVTITKVFKVPTDGTKPTVTTSFEIDVAKPDTETGTGALVDKADSESGKYEIKDDLAYGDLEIVKSLTTWEDSTSGKFESANATFEFDVVAKIGEDVVYSNAGAVHFAGPGTQSVVLEHIPAGATVTVTERYTGATYELTSDAGQTATIAADEVAQVEFDNDYTTRRRGGHGVTNQFTLEDMGQDPSVWTHMQVDGSTNAPDETQQ